MYTMSSQINIGDGKFLYVNNSDRELFCSAYKAISICELWVWIQIDPKRRSFMWDSSDESKMLQTQMFKDPINSSHSGSSYGTIMRYMEYLAIHGEEEFTPFYISNADL